MSDTTVNDDDLAALLAKREHARPNRTTWILLTLLVLTIGFVGGAITNQKFGSGSTTTSFSGPPSGFTPPGMTGSTGVTAGGFGGMTIGTVKLVDGTNVYITTTAGETVKVKVPTSATITAQQDIALTDLSAGTTVLVRGETADDGTVTATSIAEGSLPGAPTDPQASPQPTTQGAE